MRRLHCTVTPGLVRATAARGLKQVLPWKDFGESVKAATLLELVLLTAALCRTVSAIVRRFKFGFSHETARKALDANLPPLETLTQGLVDALHGWLPRAVARRAWDIAIDLHYVPFYGNPKTPGTLGGPKKAGTNRFFVYATAVIVQRGQRWCLALTPVHSTRFETAVEALAEQLQARGIRVRCLILDRGFFSGHVMLALQKRRLPFVVGVSRKKGRIESVFQGPIGKIHQHQWKTERGGHPVKVLDRGFPKDQASSATRTVCLRWHCSRIRRPPSPTGELLPPTKPTSLRNRNELSTNAPEPEPNHQLRRATTFAVVGAGAAASASVAVASAKVNAAGNSLVALASRSCIAFATNARLAGPSHTALLPRAETIAPSPTDATAPNEPT